MYQTKVIKLLTIYTSESVIIRLKNDAIQVGNSTVYLDYNHSTVNTITLGFDTFREVHEVIAELSILNTDTKKVFYSI